MEFKVVNKKHNDFPNRLLGTSLEQIHYLGNLDIAKQRAVAIVGSRKMSSYGKEVCQDIVKVLCQHNIGIVSGFMHGVDMEAHLSAFNSGGNTIGVLGYGADFLKECSNYAFANRLVVSNKGLLISEFSSNQPPAKWTFPKRDITISALAEAVVVIEAGEKSGTFYTVEACIEQGKDVLAVPGSIYNPTSRGCNKLIEDGAVIVKSTEDVINYLNIQNTTVGNTLSSKEQVSLSQNEEAIYKALDYCGLYIDDIIVKSNISPSVVISCIVSLELKGLVKDLGASIYKKI